MRKGFLSHICYINGTILRKHVVFTSPDKRLLAVKPFRCEIAHTTQCDGLLIVASKDFDKEISKIIVFPNNQLKFIFVDNSEGITIWEQTSRKNSWTDEMRENARQKTLSRKRGETPCQEQ